MSDQATAAPPSRREPSAAERDWTRSVLEPALAKAPERPIGARSGVNLDPEGNARFTTISGTPIERLYTEADLPTDFYPAHARASRRTPAAFIPPAIAASSGPCASSPDSPRRKRPTFATNTCSRRAATASPWPSICRR